MRFAVAIPQFYDDGTFGPSAFSAVKEAGAELILFTALHDQLEHAERIAADIIPRLLQPA